MDKLDRRIAEKEQSLSEAREAVIALEIEIKALRLAAALRPGSAPAAIVLRGKPQGAISDRWKDILREMVRQGNNPISSMAIMKISKNQGLNISLAGVRMRLKGLRGSGLIIFEPEKGFSVTKEGIEKFGLI